MRRFFLLLPLFLFGCALTPNSPESGPSVKINYTPIAKAGNPQILRKERKASDVARKQQRQDASLEEFIAELRMAVKVAHKGNRGPLQDLMTVNFGYNLAPIMEGAGAFEYWDQHQLWEELKLVVVEKFSPLGDYQVAPPEFASNPDTYTGYRIGVIRTPAGWKFAYFIVTPGHISSGKQR